MSEALKRAVAALSLMFLGGVANAGQPIDCSQTVGGTAAGVSFHQTPTQYVFLCDAHASNSLGVNLVGGTASIGTQGTVTLTTGQCVSINHPSLPLSISVIGSGGGTTTACGYQ